MQSQKINEAMQEILRPIPDWVRVIIVIGSYKFESEPMPGAQALNFFFQKTPHMRRAIRNLEIGEETELIPKVLHGALVKVIREGKSEVKASHSAVKAKEQGSRRDAAGRGPRADPRDFHPVTGRPITSEAERDEITRQALEGKIKIDLPPDDGEADSVEVALYEINEADVRAKPTGTLCPKCRKKLYSTSQGVICPNAHWKGKHL